MQIRTIIIDDEPHNIENTSALLEKYCPGVVIAGTAGSAAEGVSLIRSRQPDLVLLDIQMPGETGFDLLKALPRIDFEVIFVTAYDQYGIQAIKFSALDYILKPIDPSELQKAIQKAADTIAKRRHNLSLDNLMDYIRQGKMELPKIALPTLTEIMYVKVDEIVRCEASNNYTHFFLAGGETILVCKTLKEFGELLQPHGFLRTHQSHLVNVHFVKSYLKEDGYTSHQRRRKNPDIPPKPRFWSRKPSTAACKTGSSYQARSCLCPPAILACSCWFCL
ncbi:MAG: LytTR family DNA-binding domain-containing protein [Luteolibacter sp.]